MEGFVGGLSEAWVVWRRPGRPVCLVEKGAEIGSHILSGAVFETKALDELIPNWKEKGAPISTQATKDEFYLLSKKRAFRLPTPPQMHNKGNYIISLGRLCQWLGEQATELGVEIYPGFPAADILYDEQGKVNGIITGDMGIGKDGEKTPLYQPGVIIKASYTLVAEGCRGSIAERIIKQFDLRKGRYTQTYCIGIKEIWQVEAGVHTFGKVVHTIGWPLDSSTYGGSFLYHVEDNKIALGFVIGLDYQNPYLNPYQEFQTLHHFIRRNRCHTQTLREAANHHHIAVAHLHHRFQIHFRAFA